MDQDKQLITALSNEIIKLSGQMTDFDMLLEYIGDAQIVLLGEATHGTHEFYDIRAQITKRLIQEKNFNAVTIEGDWPDAYQVNKYIQNMPGQEYKNAKTALAGFDRFPTWMWRNVPIMHFVEWLKEHNNKHTLSAQKVGFYGLDVYSLYRSIDTIISILDKIDPAAADQARYYYTCFDDFRHDPQAYGYAVYTQAIASCENMVIEELTRLQEQDWQALAQNKISAQTAFNIEQNARVVKNAESYYRALFFSQAHSWNVRDSHMFETLNALIAHYKLMGIEKPKIIVWAHNSHIGNAAATQLSQHGEYNIGQLAKEHFGDNNAIAIGFTTYNGTVSAASNWHAPVERKIVRDALAQSYEALFHAFNIPDFLLLLKTSRAIPQSALQRAIGVIYQPRTERTSHYFYADIKNQFDAVIHCDKTTAIEPLEKTSHWIAGEVPETYPSGL